MAHTSTIHDCWTLLYYAQQKEKETPKFSKCTARQGNFHIGTYRERMLHSSVQANSKSFKFQGTKSQGHCPQDLSCHISHCGVSLEVDTEKRDMGSFCDHLNGHKRPQRAVGTRQRPGHLSAAKIKNKKLTDKSEQWKKSYFLSLPLA